MLHRLQTYYLTVVIVVQAIAAAGMTFFRFQSGDDIYSFNAWGYQHQVNGEILETTTIPVFIGFISLALLSFLGIMAYKNIERQFKLGRTVFYLYFVSVLTVYLLSLFGDNLIGLKESSREMGAAYWLFIAGFPFSFLANISIKRDRKILDSLKRL